MRADEQLQLLPRPLRSGVSRQHDRHEDLQSLLGYEFFTLDPESGKVQEFDKPFGPDAQQQYWLKLDDLARDLVNLLGILESEAPSGKP